MNWRWGDFSPGMGISAPWVPVEGRTITVPEGVYLLSVERHTVYLRIGDGIGPREGTPLPRGTLLQVHVPTTETWSIRSESGQGGFSLTRAESSE